MDGPCADDTTLEGTVTPTPISHARSGDGIAAGTATSLEVHQSVLAPTGLRRAKVTGFTWEQVDLARRLVWVHPDHAKGRKAMGVPLNDTAPAILHIPTVVNAVSSAS
jgi:site-specific recombinase XerC